MKKYIIVLVFALISVNLIAGGNETENKFPDNLKKHLQTKIDYPVSASSDKIEGYVVVIFEVNSEGRLIVNDSDSNHNNLKRHVTEKLGNIQLCPFDLSVGKTYSVTFYFDLI